MRVILVVMAVVSSSVLAQPAEPPPPPPPLSTTDADCYPACRRGFVCSMGECVSRCNPPCAAGQQCLETGECVAPESPAQPSVTPQYAPQYTPPPQPPAYVPEPYERPTTRAGLRVTTGWAVGAGIYGAISMAVVAALTITSLATYYQAPVPTIIGAIATIFFAISAPIVAGGAGSARHSRQVSGALGARIVGWILYGLTLASAVISVALGAAGLSVPIPLIVTLGGGGVLSLLCFTLDAFISAGQARALKEQLSATPSLSHAPYFGLVPSPGGRGLGIVGGWTFLL
jgi:hypothetical protein